MSIQHTLSQLTNQCVLCGLCAPHCPTYHLFHSENESPRGRISLLKALAEEQLQLSDDPANDFVESINHCLTCRACEKMCPSQVKYSSIINLGRKLIASKLRENHSLIRQPLLQKLTEKLLLTPLLHPLIKQACKISAPVHTLLSNNHSSIAGFITEINAGSNLSSLKQHYLIPEAKGQVVLFKGCSGDLFEQQSLIDSIKLLNACQFNVIIPPEQNCCGAVKLRHGDLQGMLSLAQKNINTFSAYLSREPSTDQLNTRAIISISNSCSGQLKEYDSLAVFREAIEPPIAQKKEVQEKRVQEKEHQQAQAELFSHKVSDIIAFLHEALKTRQIKFKPLAEEVAIHTSCSLKNVLKQESLLYELLDYIPGIRLTKLNSQYCCGAAGSYMLQYPQLSKQLLSDKMDDIMQTNCGIIVSSNIGCTLHFKQGLNKRVQQRSQKIEVIHPVSLLARQLDFKL